MYNMYGELGRDVGAGSPIKVNLGRVEALDNVTTVACGEYHSVFLKSDGTAWSCGFNGDIELGREVDNGSESSSNLGAFQ